MNSLELEVKSRTQSGAVHLQIKSSGDELGLLYLTDQQYIELLKILRVGCFNKEVDFSVNDPYNVEEDSEEENDLHTFFSID